MQEAAFNAVAPTYDADFTRSITGTLQRRRVWRYLDRYIRKPLHILEINCGTGEDALMLAGKGHNVTATDLSEAMIAAAQQKNLHAKVTFAVCGFEELRGQLTGTYDMVFSNFAGLNCVPAPVLRQLDCDLSGLLKPGGRLLMVLLGKKCWTEQLFFTLKGEREKAARRSRTALAQLNESTAQPAYYYDVAQIRELFPHFTVIEKKPVGLFIPPSYLEPLVKRYRFTVPLFRALEGMAGGISSLADYADHTFIVLQKK